MTKKKWAIDKEGFESIKKLLDMDISAPKISQITGWSMGAIYLWKQFKTWEDYCQHKKEKLERLSAKAVTPQKEKIAVPELKSALAHESLILVLRDIYTELHLLRLAWERSPKDDKSNSNWLKDKFGVRI